MTYEEACRRLGVQGPPPARMALQIVRADDLDLRGADLAGVSLCRTFLSDASLSGAQLKGADLTHAIFRVCSFDDADLRGADARHASFDGCTFRGARLDEMRVLAREVARLPMSDPQRASLRRVGPPAFEGRPTAPGPAVKLAARPALAGWLARFVTQPAPATMPLSGLGELRRVGYGASEAITQGGSTLVLGEPGTRTSFELGDDDPRWPVGTGDDVRGEAAVLAEDIASALARNGEAVVTGLGLFRRVRQNSGGWITVFSDGF
jgi:hypothetical protein